MIVLNLTDCPTGLRGDLTKWLLEIAAGVFVGQVSARVRDKLWDRVKETCRSGRAVLVYSNNNEQRLDFRIHGDTWEPIDFDGIKLMLRPSPSRLKARQTSFVSKHGFSNAAQQRAAKRFSAMRARYPETYVVIDLETTGLNTDTDDIIEFGAIKVEKSEKVETFHAFIAINNPLPLSIVSLTGITDEMLKHSGQLLSTVLTGFFAFLDNLPIVAHNMDFDKGFLQNACEKCGLSISTNRFIDTLALARRLIKGLPSYQLVRLAEHFEFLIPIAGGSVSPHRSLGDCETTRLLYEKLMNLLDDKS